MRLSTLTTTGVFLLAALVAADPRPINDITNRQVGVDSTDSGALDLDIGGDDAGGAEKREHHIAAESLHKRQTGGDSANAGVDFEDSGPADGAAEAKKREHHIAAGSAHKH